MGTGRNRAAIPRQRPMQVHGGWSRRCENRQTLIQCAVRRIGPQSQHNSVGRCRPDQRGAPDHHGLDRLRRFGHGGKAL
jgi:hypothetical protein